MSIGSGDAAVVLDYELPEYPAFEAGIRRAPRRDAQLSQADRELAVSNALRYIHPDHHAKMAAEFAKELDTHGRIYGYRFRPQGKIWGRPIDEYSGRCIEGKAMQVMIDNNLDFDVALYPYELVTYGETGQVMQNWMQYRLVKKYLELLTDEQTLVMMSGHPLGVFRSHKLSPRVIATNALMVGMFDDNDSFNRAAAIGVANYGQMTAGGWMYIGPQGIVHGTFNTLLNAGRIKLGIPEDGDLRGRLFVSSGLGGMSGAQGKAAEIAGAVALIAEVDSSRIRTRFEQGWVSSVAESCEDAVAAARAKQAAGKPCAIAFHGNIVDLLEYLIENNVHVDLLSDQTSCHVPYDGGYCPQGVSYDERTRMLSEDKAAFVDMVDKSLRRHYECVVELHGRGAYFFDYGNSFLKAVYDAGVIDVCRNGENDLDGFVFPSYVEDILGPNLFDYGYGPFRWCCLSGDPSDLDKTDIAAMECIDPDRRYQDRDNRNWVRDAKKNRLVVGTQCRILYQDALGRLNIALKFNEMVRNGEIGPVMLGRDHHDTGGTDSPFRETSNIKDGSNIMADMAVQCFAGNVARGMSLVALHNGGGVGVGKAVNGGFGMVLDGSGRVDDILRMAMPWDVMVGVARRSWARNPNALEVAAEYNGLFGATDHITMPYIADSEAVVAALYTPENP
ncbi:MAG: urocanate hydratase [Oscillospiraceae bacterium]|nr:urocanate hydratase [Oscillospiraceae bacterium]